MYVLYYVSMLRCWHIIWILVRTNHPCLGVGCHTRTVTYTAKGCTLDVHAPRKVSAEAPNLSKGEMCSNFSLSIFA
jgi:hypothetical protein